jgi:serine/threonine protein kinase/tetratricopeptide (TPR) repeat protein
MSKERWDEIRPLFFELVELESEDRAARLEALSESDPELCRRLKRLLTAHERADELLGSFEDLISRPEFEPFRVSPETQQPQSDPHGLIGRTISHYEVTGLLGGGGMGVLYKALDTQLGRAVALKFLPPQWSSDATLKERFLREARAAAALDHPNVCAIHEIGETKEGQLFIAMAYYEGETVRERLARGPLEVAEALDLASQAASGLAAAHRAGLVHRDIKPANLIVTEEGVLKILDFGLAKTDETALTVSGMTLGTPAYMSPEQTRGEAVDARTDLWSLGVVLYEMLTGQRPFRGGNLTAVIQAIRSEEPVPPRQAKGEVPAEIEALVLRLLSKDPEGRYKGMGMLSADLAASSRVLGSAKSWLHRLSPGTPWLVLGGYALFSWLVVLATEPFGSLFGLPLWSEQAVLIALALGFPVLIVTALAQTARKSSPSTGEDRRRLGWLLTWRNWLAGGVGAFALLATAMAGYTAMRTWGVGPPATLIAQGRLDARSEVVVADFANQTRDSLLGPALKTALTIDLAQSPAIRVARPRRIAAALRRMEEAPGARLDPALAREVALREGMGAVVAGTIGQVGSGYVVSVELMSPQGELLVAEREAAADSTGIIGALDRVSKSLREATERRIEPIEGALALDSSFGMAWNALAVALQNRGEDPARMMEAYSRAFQLRDRLPERERYFVAAAYHRRVTGDLSEAISAYETIVALDPGTEDDELTASALNNIGVLYLNLLQNARAQEFFERVLEQRLTRSGRPLDYANARFNLAAAQANLGRYDAAEETLREPMSRYVARGQAIPPPVFGALGTLAAARHDYKSAEPYWRTMQDDWTEDVHWRSEATAGLAALAAVQGRLEEAEQRAEEAMAVQNEHDLRARYFDGAIDLAMWNLLVRGDADEAMQILVTRLGDYTTAELHGFLERYPLLPAVYAMAGKPDQARALLAEFAAEFGGEADSRAGGENLPWQVAASYRWARGHVALAEADYEGAVSEFRRIETGCLLCPLPGLARAYDRAGRTDSALAVYERYVTTPSFWRLFDLDRFALGPALERLAQLHDERGDPDSAANYYARFVELWSEADPDLQPRVQAARARLEQIVTERG